MTATFELPAALHGKQVTSLVGTIDMTVKFDLWKDYTQWLVPSERENYWYNLCLEHLDVKIEILMHDVVVDSKILKNFETATMHGKFVDDRPEICQLQIKIINLSKLPIRDDHGSFVSAMIQLESLKLQGIEISHLLENTMFGNDSTINLALRTPVYPWMVENSAKILPDFFNLSMIDI